MPSTHSLSRYGLPLLAVMAAHGVVLVLLGRGLLAPPMPAPEPPALPVELLGPPSVAASGAPADVPSTPSVPAAPEEPMPVLPREALPPPETPALPAPPPLPAPAADALAAPGGTLQAPTADTVPAAALEAPVVTPGAYAPSGAGAGSARAAPSDVAARLAPGTREPAYPDEARRHREEGSVTLQLKVAADGRVLAVSVLRSSGFPRLDRVARDAAWRWRLLPAERAGRPVESLFEKTLYFRLED